MLVAGRQVGGVPLHRPGGGRAGPKPTHGTLTPVLVFATTKKGFQKQVKCEDLGFTFAGKADWR